MQVTLLFFAGARDATGHATLAAELPDTVTNVGELLVLLGREFPALLPHLVSVRIARNEEFVNATAPISAGDVLAVIPPVAGG